MAKALNKDNILMILLWATYLTATMAVFEHYSITPELVGGVIGWTLIVEVPRVILGWIIIQAIRKKVL